MRERNRLLFSKSFLCVEQIVASKRQRKENVFIAKNREDMKWKGIIGLRWADSADSPEVDEVSPRRTEGRGMLKMERLCFENLGSLQRSPLL